MVILMSGVAACLFASKLPPYVQGIAGFTTHRVQQTRKLTVFTGIEKLDHLN